MKKNYDDGKHDISLDDGWSVPSEGGVGRRSIVRGAVWTVPVVAGVAAAPLAAASTTPCTPSITSTGAAYIRDSSDGWFGELLSNSSGDRLGIGVALPGSRMKANYAFKNATNCTWTGTIQVQIDLPARTVANPPESNEGWTRTTAGNYTRDNLTYTRYVFTATASVAANSTRQFGLGWTLADQATLRTYLGAPGGPQRWTKVAADSGSTGWRLPNPPGAIRINGATVHSGFSNTLTQNAGYWIHFGTEAF
ncbi:hypothetical protein [Rathayibacter tanaceti]|uniref:Uncharacterized protein n=2 Tax=Rathayibacter tanaceti TaxID=1671680 RepID=A0A162GI98_9MICO|nr:hypothetical protein [Rathayibacter tanaceti]KZX21619.1 hypothetical protein ACH61_01221 [Rathayibacter tanaceti]QHC56482.1 hypothetical protein GSU10_13155 [Rathayibacter tanaceti]TCO36689.1 hypothetical protein EV639_10692 [Rathayibacter tanaceti]